MSSQFYSLMSAIINFWATSDVKWLYNFLCKVLVKSLKKEWGGNPGSWTHIISTPSRDLESPALITSTHNNKTIKCRYIGTNGLNWACTSTRWYSKRNTNQDHFKEPFKNPTNTPMTKCTFKHRTSAPILWKMSLIGTRLMATLLRLLPHAFMNKTRDRKWDTHTTSMGVGEICLNYKYLVLTQTPHMHGPSVREGLLGIIG